MSTDPILEEWTAAVAASQRKLGVASDIVAEHGLTDPVIAHAVAGLYQDSAAVLAASRVPPGEESTRADLVDIDLRTHALLREFAFAIYTVPAVFVRAFAPEFAERLDSLIVRALALARE